MRTCAHVSCQCRCLFSTQLCDEFSDSPTVLNFHMSARALAGTVVFLYKFVEGSCPKSYGMNVARLAGLDEETLGYITLCTLRIHICLCSMYRSMHVHACAPPVCICTSCAGGLRRSQQSWRRGRPISMNLLS
eukprot:GHVS01001667.1.p2 GENE.GHVS01001667.1~~GHVS01001667.1.p2  ORF type:complete len:133 (+),score=5.63 GHVS01001667.1:70-468(+)